MQALGPSQVEIGLVDGSHLHQRREVAQHGVSALGIFAVAVHVSVDEDGLRTQLGRSPQRHGRMHSKLSRRIRSRRNHAPLVALSAYDDGLALEGRVVEFFDRDEEGVHVDVEDGAGRGLVLVHFKIAGE